MVKRGEGGEGPLKVQGGGRRSADAMSAWAALVTWQEWGESWPGAARVAALPD